MTTQRQRILAALESPQGARGVTYKQFRDIFFSNEDALFSHTLQDLVREGTVTRRGETYRLAIGKIRAS